MLLAGLSHFDPKDNSSNERNGLTRGNPINNLLSGPSLKLDYGILGTRNWNPIRNRLVPDADHQLFRRGVGTCASIEKDLDCHRVDETFSLRLVAGEIIGSLDPVALGKLGKGFDLFL